MVGAAAAKARPRMAAWACNPCEAKGLRYLRLRVFKGLVLGVFGSEVRSRGDHIWALRPFRGILRTLEGTYKV